MIDAFLVSYVESIRNSVIDALVCFPTNYLANVVMLIFMFLALFFSKRRKLAYFFVPPYFMLGGVIILIKILVGRIRPFEAMNLSLINCVEYAFESWNGSFPSWHAAFIFLFVPFLVKAYGKKAYWFLIVSVLFSLVRVYTGVHYFSDVVFGGILGYLVGFLVVKWVFKRK